MITKRKLSRCLVGTVLAGSLATAGLGCQSQPPGSRSPASSTASPATTPIESTSDTLARISSIFGSTVADTLRKAEANTAADQNAKAAVDSAIQFWGALAQMMSDIFTTQAMKTYTTTLPDGKTIKTTFESNETTDPEDWTVKLDNTTVLTGKVAKNRQSGYLTISPAGLSVFLGAVFDVAPEQIGQAVPSEQLEQATVTASWEIKEGTVTLRRYRGTSPSGTLEFEVIANQDGHGSYFVQDGGSGTF